MPSYLDDHPLPALLALILLALLGIFLLWKKGYRYQAKPLLTANELGFYAVLRDALAEYAVFPQVAMNAFIRPAAGLGAKEYAATRGTFAQKHVDFLVCDPETLAVLAIVELDDQTHCAEKDAARDRITAAAGYKTLRFHSRNKPSAGEIRQTFAALCKARPGSRTVAY